LLLFSLSSLTLTPLTQPEKKPSETLSPAKYAETAEICLSNFICQQCPAPRLREEAFSLSTGNYKSFAEAENLLVVLLRQCKLGFSRLLLPRMNFLLLLPVSGE
jgi:hypothetical protein